MCPLPFFGGMKEFQPTLCAVGVKPDVRAMGRQTVLSKWAMEDPKMGHFCQWNCPFTSQIGKVQCGHSLLWWMKEFHPTLCAVGVVPDVDNAPRLNHFVPNGHWKTQKCHTFAMELSCLHKQDWQSSMWPFPSLVDEGVSTNFVCSSGQTT